MSRKILNKFLRKWVRILKLSKPKWDKITIDFGAEELQPEAVGFCRWSTEERKAEVFVISPKEYLNFFNEEINEIFVEKVIIHELLHLMLEGGKSGKIKYEIHFEQGLNILADVLFEAWQ